MSTLFTADVWQLYPEGGDELVVALALADRAADDGTLKIDDPDFLEWKCRVPFERLLELLDAMMSRGLLQPKGNPDDFLYQLTLQR